MLLFSEGQTGENWALSNKTMLFSNSGALEGKFNACGE
jgi:hypothetical protein